MFSSAKPTPERLWRRPCTLVTTCVSRFLRGLTPHRFATAATATYSLCRLTSVNAIGPASGRFTRLTGLGLNRYAVFLAGESLDYPPRHSPPEHLCGNMEGLLAANSIS